MNVLETNLGHSDDTASLVLYRRTHHSLGLVSRHTVDVGIEPARDGLFRMLFCSQAIGLVFVWKGSLFSISALNQTLIDFMPKLPNMC